MVGEIGIYSQLTFRYQDASNALKSSTSPQRHVDKTHRRPPRYYLPKWITLHGTSVLLRNELGTLTHLIPVPRLAQSLTLDHDRQDLFQGQTGLRQLGVGQLRLVTLELRQPSQLAMVLRDLVELIFTQGEEIMHVKSVREEREDLVVVKPILISHRDTDDEYDFLDHGVALDHSLKRFWHLNIEPIAKVLHDRDGVSLIGASFADEPERAEEEVSILGLNDVVD
jgi:hypothetical protein